MFQDPTNTPALEESGEGATDSVGYRLMLERQEDRTIGSLGYSMAD